MKEAPEFTPYKVGLCYASVCTRLSDQEATDRLNATCPTGLDHGWKIADEPFASGDPNPSPCCDGGPNRHILFVC